MRANQPDSHGQVAARATSPDTGARRTGAEDTDAALTTAQHLMWTGQQIHAEAPLYNMILAFRIRGMIDADRFLSAWERVVASSDSLRTVLRYDRSGHPLRHVGLQGPSTEFIDLTHETDPDRAYQVFVEDRRRRIFDLTDSLTDSVLLRLREADFVWYLNQHHLITDGWSAAIVFEYVEQAYREGAEFCNDEIPQYSGYVAFERRHRKSKLFDRAASYWRERLTARPRPIDLYGNLLGEANPTTNRTIVELGVPRSERIREAAREAVPGALTKDVGLFNVFMAALAAYLHRVSGQSQLRIGAPAHNRPRPDLKRTIGLFIEVLPFEVEVDEEDTFETLIEKVSVETLRFLRLAQPGVSSTRSNTSFNVLLNFVHASFPSFAGFRTETDWIHTGYGDAGHHLRLQVHDFDQDGGLSLHFDFNTDLLDEQEQIDAGQHFLNVLDGLLDDRSRRIAELSLLTDSQRKRVLAYSNGPIVDQVPAPTLPALIASVSEMNPDTSAVSEGSGTTTYRDLARQSESVARALRTHGVARGECVGVLLERSMDLLPALLGVMRAGGAYVPLDPVDPAARTRAIMDDSGAGIVLCAAESAARVESEGRTPLIVQEAIHFSGQDGDLPELHLDDTAYVMYTSGSTGRPKGVVVTHGSLANYVLWARSVYAPREAVSLPLYTSHSFDLTVTSLFLPLVTGGSVVVYGRDTGGPDTSILRVVNDDAVDVLKLTPSHFGILRGLAKGTPRITKLIFGGEALRRDVAEAALDVFGTGTEIFNEYGPTEATVGCMIHKFGPDRDLDPDVPIGHPITNSQIYLLDQGLSPVPPGVVAELFVGGAGVARGYHRRQDLTEDRFIESPFDPGDKLYRTGDLAVMDDSGVIHYRGRRDRQLKMHGYRIERGEVEAALLEHPYVDDCVLTVVTNETADGKDIRRCTRCGLGADYPGTAFDEHGVCNTCQDFDDYRDRALDFFGSMDDLYGILDRECERKTGEYDCLVLLSGGKDSTYLLYRMAETGRKLLAFTLDNGFISERAKENIDRVVRDVGVDHIYGTTPAMNEIFVDSLNRFANVCNGCFKAIYTLAIKEAKTRGIPVIVTGLSRGQLFETRLSGDLFSGDAVPIESIEETILTARKTYHQLDDAVSRLLQVDDIINEATFDEVAFVDFYRYCDVELEELYDFLSTRAPWIRPDDTGRSTNCLINEAGIFVHKRKRGFHNYAWPYSWDVRMGHKVRDDALEELDDDIDPDNVLEMLHEIGYTDVASEPSSRLAMYYSADRTCTSSELRDFLSARLPEYMVPTVYVEMDALPRTASGKMDLDALPRPSGRERELVTPLVDPRNDVERTLASIWGDALGVDHVGVQDNFFDLGGDSITAIQIVAKANREGLQITPAQLFRGQTIEALAASVGSAVEIHAEQGIVVGQVALTPIQHRFFEFELQAPDHWNQVVWLNADRIDVDDMTDAVNALVAHHDALRFRFSHVAGQWEQTAARVEDATVGLEYFDFSNLDEVKARSREAWVTEQLSQQLDLREGPLLAGAICRRSRGDRIVFVAHHLVVDSISWMILAGDLNAALRQLAQGEDISMPPKTSSFRQWSNLLHNMSASDEVSQSSAFWREMTASTCESWLPSKAKNNMTEGDSTARILTLAPRETELLLTQVRTRYGAEIDEILLALLTAAVTSATGVDSVTVDLEGHGRGGFPGRIDIIRTVGWFTTVYPLTITVDRSGDAGAWIKTVQELRRRVPYDGISYGLLRYLSTGDSTEGRVPASPAAVLFNYLGRLTPGETSERVRFDGELTVSKARKNRRPYPLEVNAWVVDGKLSVEFSYANGAVPPDLATRIRSEFDTQLNDLLNSSDEPPGADPAIERDFGMSSSQLVRIASLLNEVDDATDS